MAINAILRDDVNALIPEPITKEILQGAITTSTVLSTFRQLPNMSSKTQTMNVLDMLPMAYWVDGDTGTKQTTKMQWDKKKIYAEELAVIVPIPESVLDDSNYDIWGEVKPRLIEAFGKEIDKAIIFGENKPSSWRTDIFTTAVTAGNVVTESDDIYNDIMGVDGLISFIEHAGYMPNNCISAINMRAKLRGLKNTMGNPIFKTDMQGSTQYSLDGVPMYFPLNGAYDSSKANMIIGDFTQAVYSIRQDMTFKVFTEGIVQDPVTKDIVYNLMQNDMIALRAVMRLGWEIPNPIKSLKPDKTKRCPFAIYKPKTI